MTIPSNENWDAFYNDDDDEIFIHKMKGNKIIRSMRGGGAIPCADYEIINEMKVKGYVLYLVTWQQLRALRFS